MSSTPELPGYRITRAIGTGAGSRIYLGKETASGRTVAIKHVVRHTPDDDRFIEQAETEYAVSSGLTHPNLRKSFAIHRVKKLLVVREVMLVMEYIDGLALDKARPNRLTTFLALFRKVASGLHALHEAGYVHTDLKPINIMLAAGGVVKIIDFGQACAIRHRKERIQGTPDYIAPEQVRRLPLDQRTDVFNLGATMYWVLTSENYPTALRGADAGQRLTTGKAIAPVELNDKIPLSLSNLVMECCRNKPGERPADMNQVIARLGVVEKLWKKYRDGLRPGSTTSRPPGTDESSAEL